jgi:hypothetical protein
MVVDAPEQEQSILRLRVYSRALDALGTHHHSISA